MVIALSWSPEEALISKQELAFERACIDRISQSRLAFCAAQSGEETEDLNSDTALDENFHGYIRNLFELDKLWMANNRTTDL